MPRSDGRASDELRPIKITPDYLQAPIGSCLIEIGKTRVVCSAMVEDTVPPFLKNTRKGWLTAEYGMLPASSKQRIIRERARIGGRTHEIQRLIGRALRTCIDLTAIGEKTIQIDCDVLDADGGTRTAAITGAYVALVLGISKLQHSHAIPGRIIKGAVAAVSVGIVHGVAVLDLHYDDDKDAEVDMNVVKTSENQYVELQGTAETKPFNADQLTELLQLADKGLASLFDAQRKILGSHALF